jgi:hypothetical protein
VNAKSQGSGTVPSAEHGRGATKPSATLPDSAPTTVQQAEPEDAYLTGGRRNLQRRVLGLNVEGGQARRPEEQSAGIHSTGSFTGTANGQTKP